VMEETLDAAVARLLGATPRSPQPPAGAAVPQTVQELITQAAAAYRRAQQLLRQGDLAGYAREIDRLGEILQRIEALEK